MLILHHQHLLIIPFQSQMIAQSFCFLRLVLSPFIRLVFILEPMIQLPMFSQPARIRTKPKTKLHHWIIDGLNGHTLVIHGHSVHHRRAHGHPFLRNLLENGIHAVHTITDHLLFTISDQLHPIALRKTFPLLPRIRILHNALMNLPVHRGRRLYVWLKQVDNKFPHDRIRLTHFNPIGIC